MNGQKRGINHFRRQPGFANFAGGRMKTADIDPFAQAASRGRALLHIFESGIGAEVYEVATVSGLRSQGTGRKECGQQRRYIDDQPVPTEHSRFLGFHWLSHPAAFTITSHTLRSNRSFHDYFSYFTLEPPRRQINYAEDTIYKI